MDYFCLFSYKTKYSQKIVYLSTPCIFIHIFYIFNFTMFYVYLFSISELRNRKNLIGLEFVFKKEKFLFLVPSFQRKYAIISLINIIKVLMLLDILARKP